MLNEGIKTFIFVCGDYLCVEEIKSVNSHNGLTNYDLEALALLTPYK